MSEEVQRVEVITSVQRRRRWSVAEKIRLVEETFEPGMSVSFVARKHGLSPSLLFKWRQRVPWGGREAVRADDVVVGAARVRQLEERIPVHMRLLRRWHFPRFTTAASTARRVAANQKRGRRPVAWGGLETFIVAGRCCPTRGSPVVSFRHTVGTSADPEVPQSRGPRTS
jgi:transposase